MADLRTELLQLAAAKPPPAPPRSPDDHSYRELNGGIYLIRRDVEGREILVPLTNFTARITGDVVRDDGAEREAVFEIEAKLRGSVHRFIVSSSRFNAMNWPPEYLGAEGIVYPGSSIRDHARAAIQFLSPRPVPRRTIYTHTGWRKLDGGNGGLPLWVYLHGGGAIGAAGAVGGVQVELTGALASYHLADPPQGDELKTAIRATLNILDLAADPIILPIYCAVWRAALAACDFALHLAGPSGVFKSEVAALAQQFFGLGMDRLHLPGSWQSTDNALEGLLFSAKDAVTAVDDFAPCGGPHDVARWHQRADRVIRAQGNNAGRSRMNADGTLRPPKPPRGLMLSTGEDIPRGQSLRARMLILEISKGDVDLAMLTRCQKDARSGVYTAALAGFVQYLAARYEEIRQSLWADVEDLRSKAAGDGHCRTPEIVANLALGLRYFIAYAQHSGAVSETDGGKLWQRGWAALGDAASKQADHQAAAEPTQRFIELLTSALASGHAHLADADGKAPPNAGAWGWREVTIGNGVNTRNEWQPQGDRIGWLDGPDVLLDPDASYRAMQTMTGMNGDALSISARTLRKRLDEKRMVIRPGERDELLSRRVLEGRTRRVLHLAGGVLSAQPAIPAIPASNPAADSKNGDKWRETLAGSPPNPAQPASATRQRNPPFAYRKRPQWWKWREWRVSRGGYPCPESD